MTTKNFRENLSFPACSMLHNHCHIRKEGVPTVLSLPVLPLDPGRGTLGAPVLLNAPPQKMFKSLSGI